MSTTALPEPAPQRGSTQLVLNRAFVRLHWLERWFDRLRRESGEREDAESLQEILRVVHVWLVETQRRLVEDARALSGNDEDLENTWAKWLEVVENTVSGLTPLIARPHGHDFAPLVGPFRRLANSLVPGSELLFQATEEWTYLLRSQLQEILEKNADFALDNADLAAMVAELSRISVVTFPVINEADVFQQLMIGHELGHLVLRKPDDGSTFAERLFLRDAIEVTAVPEGLSEKEIDQAQKRARSWFTEIACDLLAFDIVGPGYALALLEFARPHNAWLYAPYWRKYDTYPSVALRLSILAEELGRFSLADSNATEPWPVVRAVFENAIASVPAIPQSTDDEAVYTLALCDSALKAVRSAVPGLIRHARYPPQRFRRDVSVVWKKLENHIAPSERVRHRSQEGRFPSPWVKGDRWSVPIDWRSIVNVGYIHWLHHHPNDLAPTFRERAIDAEERRKAFSIRIYGSVELSELQREMGALKIQLGVLDEPSLGER
jgi:hypothetical protein